MRRPRTPIALLACIALLFVWMAGAPEVLADSADVRMHEHIAFSLHSSRAGQSAPERARAASRALEGVLDDPDQPMTHVEERPGSAVIFVGRTPIATLGDE